MFHKGENHETYNIGGFNEWKNIDLVKLLCEQMDEKLDRASGTSEKLITYVKDRPGHDLRYAMCGERMKDQLNWEPKPVRERLAEVTKWTLENTRWLDI